MTSYLVTRVIRLVLVWVGITLGLLARGYSDDDARRIMGGNFLRVFGEVWR